MGHKTQEIQFSTSTGKRSQIRTCPLPPKRTAPATAPWDAPRRPRSCRRPHTARTDRAGQAGCRPTERPVLPLSYTLGLQLSAALTAALFCSALLCYPASALVCSWIHYCRSRIRLEGRHRFGQSREHRLLGPVQNPWPQAAHNFVSNFNRYLVVVMRAFDTGHSRYCMTQTETVCSKPN